MNNATPILDACRLLLGPGQVTEIRIPETRYKTVSGYFSDVEKLAAAAAQWSGQAAGVYFLPNVVKPALLARAANQLKTYAKYTTSDADIERRRWLLLDFDPVRPAGISSTEEEHQRALARMQECCEWLISLGFPRESLVKADSGNGAHALVAIDLPNTPDSTALVKRCLEAVALHFSDASVAVDLTVFSAGQPWKLYGTWAGKGDSIPERPHRLACILEAPAQLETASRELLEHLAALAPEEAKTNAKQTYNGKASFDIEQWITEHELAVIGPTPWQNGGRKWIFPVCPWDAAHTNKSAVIVQFASGAIAAKCHHNGCVGKDWHALRDLVEPGWKEWRDKKQRGNGNGHAPEEPPETDLSSAQTAPRETIQLNNTQLRDPVDQSVEALQQHNIPPTLFRWGEGLARIHHDAGGRPIVQIETKAALKLRLSRVADFIRVTKKKEEWVQTAVSPTQELAESILALSTWPFPALVGLTECPCLRPDGTVITEHGYDGATALFYEPAPGLTLPAIPAEPSQADAKAALKYLLDDLLIDFPFVEPADRTNMLACLLTPIVRSAILGNVPLCLLDKPSPGSGASLLSDLVGLISTGKHAAKQTAPEGRYAEEEWRKRLTSLVLSGVAVVVFDNLENGLFSSTLASIVTATRWSDRLLGQNIHVEVPVRQTWIATANNIILRGDLARRSYRIRIDAKSERPWQRDDFKQADLLSWVQDHRGDLLAALLTMARAWYANGKPQPAAKIPKLGGFEQWASVCGGILAYAGATGFLDNLEALYGLVDDEAPQWGGFLKAWFDEFGDTPKTVADFWVVAQTKPPLSEAIPESVEWDTEKLNSSKKKLGNALKKRVDRIYSGYRLERFSKASRGHIVLWKVSLLGGSGGSASTQPKAEKKEEKEEEPEKSTIDLRASKPPKPPEPPNQQPTEQAETGEACRYCHKDTCQLSPWGWVCRLSDEDRKRWELRQTEEVAAPFDWETGEQAPVAEGADEVKL